MSLSGATTPGQSGPGIDDNEGFTLHYWNLTIRLVGVICRTLIWGGGSYCLCRETVGVFYSPRWLDKNECRKLAQKEYKNRHDWMRKVIHCELCKKLKFHHTNKWFMHKPESWWLNTLNSERSGQIIQSRLEDHNSF